MRRRSYLFLSVAAIASASVVVDGFSPSAPSAPSKATHVIDEAPTVSSRADFLSFAATGAGAAASLVVAPSTASARGRATLEASYDRYTPRIVAGAQFYAKDLKKIIEKNDWKALEAATSDPPKKTKADRVKVDGGVAERAAQAGGFSDARVLVAADLYAAAFSDNSISAKTKNMKEQVEKMRGVVQGMNLAARQALGEEKASGGLFGIGAKQPSQVELAKAVRSLYVEGGNAFNQYIFLANEELPVQLKKIDYL